jgi:hypothetical protein
MSLELSAENVEIVLLGQEGALSAFAIKHFHEDTDPDQDRIVVHAMPRQVECPGISQNEAKLWRIPVEVTIHAMNLTASQFDAIIAAVQGANTAPFPAAAVTSAQTEFTAGGPDIDNTDEGESAHSDNERTHTKVFNFIVNA